jgi:hypothetical protein
MRYCRLVDALFLCIGLSVALVPTVGHLLLATPVLAGVAGRAVLRRRAVGREATTVRDVRRPAVWHPQGAGI